MPRLTKPDASELDDADPCIGKLHPLGTRVILDLVAKDPAWDSIMSMRPQHC